MEHEIFIEKVRRISDEELQKCTGADLIDILEKYTVIGGMTINDPGFDVIRPYMRKISSVQADWLDPENAKELYIYENMDVLEWDCNDAILKDISKTGDFTDGCFHEMTAEMKEIVKKYAGDQEIPEDFFDPGDDSAYMLQIITF